MAAVEEPDLGPETSGIAGDLEESFRTGTEQQIIDDLFVLQSQGRQLLSDNEQILREVHRLFENDWSYSAAVGQEPPPFNPTSPISSSDLIVSPVNGAERLVGLYQQALRTLDVYTELLGNPTLEGELVAAVKRGARGRLIAPVHVNGGKLEIQDRQLASLAALAASGLL
jgi:hypothetical protein